MAEAHSATNPAHGTSEAGHFDEKAQAPNSDPAPTTKTKVEEEEEEDEDIDALIEDLESQDGHGEDDEEEEATPGGKPRLNFACVLASQCMYRVGLRA